MNLSTQLRSEAIAMQTPLENSAQFERLMRRSLHRMTISNFTDVRGALDALDRGIEHPLIAQLTPRVRDLQQRLP